MKRRSITQRWLLNTLGIILLIFIVLEIILTLCLKNYYYTYAKDYMSSTMKSVTNSISKAASDENLNYNSEIRNAVQNFQEKNKIELMAIDSQGRVITTSSGFSAPDDIDMTDFEKANNDSNGFAYSTSKLPDGQKVFSICSMIPTVSNSQFVALKMVTSLESIDNQIIVFVIIMTVVFTVIILLITLSGLYFVKSIVIPVKEIGVKARHFARGDFSLKIEKKNDDELGELCDIINSMADELSSADTMKNEFISSVSHELRTPLTAIKGWSETLINIDDRETMVKGMKVITNETERLSQMVEELLDFSRIQDGRFALVKSTMDILAELGEAVMIYQAKAHEEGKTVNYDEPEMLSFVYGDKNRLRQVFINIIDNAIKYSDEGDTVNVSVFEQNEFIHVIIADTGCGIKESDLPKIKTKFYKANHTRRGSGVGLAVADEIIQMHGGSLDITSKENIGTTVEIKIPVEPKKQINTEEETEEKERNSEDE